MTTEDQVPLPDVLESPGAPVEHFVESPREAGSMNVQATLALSPTEAPTLAPTAEPTSAPQSEMDILRDDLAAAEAKLFVLEDRIRNWVNELIQNAPHPWQKGFHLHLLDNLDELIKRVKEAV